MKTFALAFLLVIIFFASFSVEAAEKGSGICSDLPEITPQRKIGSPQDPPPVEEANPGKSTRDKRILRDLDDEYQRGGLTKTEYIQRRRELDNLEK